ncbi:unnamed protein product [Arabidopsis arenosa]|uniref:CDC20/Fizzy WD40 domain-containing protein n=1 Tax=Arabidopsis arenosa TaxID=38785 RepID=A0A8S2A1H1_ARAAE|nr:unnamed protein product [Arabidopsis arenosa]
MVAALEGNKKELKGITLTQGSDKLFSVSSDGTLRIWDCNSGACKHCCKRNAFSGTSYGSILVWKATDSESDPFKYLTSLQGRHHSGEVTCFIVGGQLLYSGYVDRTIKVWDLNTLQCIMTLKQHTGTVTSFLCWDKCLISSSLDGTIKVSACSENGSLNVVQTRKEEQSVHALCGMHDAEAKPIIFCSYQNRTVAIFDLPSFKERGKMFSTHTIGTLTIGPEGLLFSGDKSGNLCVLTLLHTSNLKFDAHFNKTSSPRKLPKKTLRDLYQTDQPWSESGQHLASGGNDNVVNVWDCSTGRSLHRFEEHTSAVKALAWCPFQSGLLATGGGGEDRTIKFWNTRTGACLNSVDTGSQVCSLIWSNKERELLSSHGFTQNQLTLWKYPSMVKMAELNGHTSRVLYMSQSPDGCTVASAAGDETLRLWNVFGIPEDAKKAAPKAVPQPFSNVNRIR